VVSLLTNTYLGRRIVYLDHFDATLWIDTVRREHITHPMVVPTMLARIASELASAEASPSPLPLRALSYGGARTPRTVIEQIMEELPATDLNNAYGLTETSSTIAVLGPDDHRAALASADPAVRSRLSSAGRVLPTVEVEVRGPEGAPLPVVTWGTCA
jgi:acyl-CoA synthetase (AMP-forming)/AMP-acid ligase II